ncbi:MAG: hypothetical protein WBC60_11995 [Cognaticolwellia sp.]|jgi:hypothetical protein
MKQILLALILLLLFACSPSQKLADVSLNVIALNNDEYHINKIKVTSSDILQQLIDIKLQGKSVQVSLTGSPEYQSGIDELVNLIRLTPELSGIEIVVILQSDFGHHGT